MTTCRGQHALIDIHANGPDMEMLVVRWCERCGAVSVDIDVDGRTSPGAIRPMQLPQIESEKQGKP